MTSRRQLIRNSACLLGGMTLLPSGLEAFFKKHRFKIGACDWSLGKTADPSGLTMAKEIGLNGLQVSLGTLSNNMHLRQASVQQQYKELSQSTGVTISSLGIGELNQVPYKSDPRTDEWVWDSVEVAKQMGVKVVLLAFFSKNDLRRDAVGKAEVVRKLKEVAPRAEKMGITLGIESYLTAEEHLDIMEKVGSSAVKVYYDFRNAADAGNDIYHELELLGSERICELHMKENGVLLGQGGIDWPKVARSLESINYKGDGWMQIEWARPENLSIVESYRHNLAYLRTLFI